MSWTVLRRDPRSGRIPYDKARGAGPTKKIIGGDIVVELDNYKFMLKEMKSPLEELRDSL